MSGQLAALSTADPDTAVPTTTPGFVVLDAGLSDRPPLGQADDYDAATPPCVRLLAAVQQEFYDQLDANGEGGHNIELALAVAPVDTTGTVGRSCYWVTINGMRPADR